jgi:hypothetical protein
MSKIALEICLCCLEQAHLVPVAVGPEKGNQRDPYRDYLHICVPCGNALLKGDFGALARRYTASRTIERRPI